MQIYNTELCHFGIKGMKWGKGQSTFENNKKMLKKDAINTVKFQNEDTKRESNKHYSKYERSIQKEAYKNVMSGKVVRKQTGKTWNFNSDDLKTIDDARIEYGKRETKKNMLKIGLLTIGSAASLVGANYLAEMNMIKR
jgi:hypothetical protein